MPAALVNKGLAMSEQLAQRIQRHEAATLPPSHPSFAHLDLLISQIEEQPRQPRRALLKLRKRFAERAIPAFTPQARGGQ